MGKVDHQRTVLRVIDNIITNNFEEHKMLLKHERNIESDQKFVVFFKWVSKTKFRHLHIDLFNHRNLVPLFLPSLRMLDDSVLPEIGTFLGDELVDVVFTGFQKIGVLLIMYILQNSNCCYAKVQVSKRRLIRYTSQTVPISTGSAKRRNVWRCP